METNLFLQNRKTTRNQLWTAETKSYQITYYAGGNQNQTRKSHNILDLRIIFLSNELCKAVVPRAAQRLALAVGFLIVSPAPVSRECEQISDAESIAASSRVQMSTRARHQCLFRLEIFPWHASHRSQNQIGNLFWTPSLARCGTCNRLEWNLFPTKQNTHMARYVNTPHL